MLRRLARNTILTFMTQRDLICANLIATPVQIILPYLHFNPLPQAMFIRLLGVYLQIKLLVVIKLTPKSWKTSHQLSLPLKKVLSTIPLLWVLFHFRGRKQKSFQFLSPGTVKSLRTRGQYHYCLVFLKYAKLRAAHSQFTNFLDSNNVIHHLQSGNRKLHSTESALLHFTDELLNNMDQKKISVVVLLDMFKAFDSIRHDLMLRKKAYWYYNCITWNSWKRRKNGVRISFFWSHVALRQASTQSGPLCCFFLFVFSQHASFSDPKK